MKKIKISYLLTILLIGLSLANDASAQGNQPVKIDNVSGETRKICMYPAEGQIGKISVLPSDCFTLKHGESTLWYRNGRMTNFTVKIFKPALLDQFMFHRYLPATTGHITMFVGERFNASAFEQKAPPPPTKYILRACNKQYDQKVYFTLGFESNKAFATHGWWHLAKGDCTDIEVSEMMKSQWNLDYGNLPRTFYYARTDGNLLQWRGGDSDYQLCVNSKPVFKKLQFELDASGGYKPLDCTGEGERFVRFRRLPDPKVDQPIYYLTF